MIKIELTNEEAELFKSFRQYQDDFESIIESKALEVRNGKAVLNFSSEGLMNIEITFLAYLKGCTKK